MTTDNNGNLELEQLRRIMLGPIEESNAARDKKILDFIKAEMAATAERLERMEARLNDISALVENDRRDTLAEIGGALTELGQHLERQASGSRADELLSNVRNLVVGDKVS